MKGTPKYQVKHCRKTINLGLWLYSTPASSEQKEHNKVIANLAEQKLSEANIAMLQNKGEILPIIKHENILAKWELKAVNIYAKKYLTDYLGRDNLSLSEVTNDFLLNYAKHLNSLHRVSAYRYWLLFKSYLQTYVENGKLSPAVFKGVKVQNISTQSIKKQCLTKAELELLEALPKDKYLDAFLFSCYTGLRISDINRLKWENIDFINQTCNFIQWKVRRAKNAPLSVPLCAKALEILQRQNANNEHVFTALQSKHFSVPFKKHLQKCGINKHISFHCARHTFATIMLNNGVDLLYVSKLCGHSALNITQMYVTLSTSKKMQAVSIFDM